MKRPAIPDRCLWPILLTIALTVLPCPNREVLAQNPLPDYQRIFENPPRTDLLTPADLPNLGRLAVLEATSMFVHARSELANSPNAFRMLDEIRTLWNAADAFTAAVADDPTTPLGLAAGRLAFSDLEAAFNQVRNSFSVLPGGAQLAARDLINLTRIIAVIGPLLRQGEEEAATARPRVVALGPAVQAQAREMLVAAAALQRQIDDAPGDRKDRKALDEEMQALRSLVEGLGRIAEAAVGVRDLGASLRPIRSQLQRLGLALQRSGLADVARSDEWRTLRQRADDLADRLQLPREIVVPHSAPALPAEPILQQLDRATAAADQLIGNARERESAPDTRLIAGDARRLRSRILLLRQVLIGREPAATVAQALRGVQQARDRLVEAADRAGQPGKASVESLTREVDAAIRQTRAHLSPAR